MLYSIHNQELRVLISDLGAELQSIQRIDGLEYLWQGDPQYWEGRAPIIFPYVAQLTEDTYLYHGIRYHMPIHGFASKSTFQVEQSSDARLVFSLIPDEAISSLYPFDFVFQVVYTLNDSRIAVEYIVENRGKSGMFFGTGGHPGFRVPLENALSFEDYYLEFDVACSPTRLYLSDVCFPNGNTAPFALEDGRRLNLRHDIFDEYAIVLSGMSKQLSLRSSKGDRGVTVDFPDANFLGIWHAPNTDAPYVCIEPWTSLPSRYGVIEALEKQENLITLPSGQTYVFRWAISIC